MDYRFKKALVLMAIFAVFSMTFVSFIRGTSVSAEDSLCAGGHKFYKSYVVEHGDTLWGIAQAHMTEEYTSIQSYIDEVIEANDLGSDYLRDGQLIVLPCYADNAEY